MSQKIQLILAILFFSILGCTKVQQKSSDFPILRGPYLGQKPPGMIPEIFATGVISTESFTEGGCAFTLDAELFLFNRRLPHEAHSNIYVTELKDGIWTTPSPAPFNSKYADWDYHFAPDGRTFYFTSKRPLSETGEPSQYGQIWVTQLNAAGWTPPRMLEYPINTTDSHNIYPSVTREGTLYFFSRRDGGFGERDVYSAKLTDGKYREVKNLGEDINTEYAEYDLYVAPDESYIIFSSDRPGGYGEYNDVYIAFRKNESSWTEPENLGREFRDSGVSCVTLDGKFIFFTTGRTGKSDIYWVDAKIIEKFIPDDLK
jgi:Tol biopolymer transport system component